MKFLPSPKSFAVTVLGLGLSAGSAFASPYTFASVTFEQDSTPDIIKLLGNGQTIGGFTFSASLPNNITQSVGFGSSSGNSGAGFVAAPGFAGNPGVQGEGWATARSLGEQANNQLGVTQSDGSSSLFSSAVNLPRGNNGASTRHGIEVSWTGQKGLVNQAGNDFVVYESGSLNVPEAFMTRALKTDGTYTSWFFQDNQTFQSYVQTPATTDGAFAHAFDLSNYGLGIGDLVVAIQIANLVSADRLSFARTTNLGLGGQVYFDGVSGFAHNFAGNSLDPDPLYVGIMSQLAAVPEPMTVMLLGSGLLGAGVIKRKRQTL